MPADVNSERPLFGGAISATFPPRFQDVSNIRQVPDHQEVFVDPARDESLIFELLDFKHDVGDDASAVWFLQDLASEQEAEGGMMIEQSGVVEAPGLCYRNIPAAVTTAVGQMDLTESDSSSVKALPAVHRQGMNLIGIGGKLVFLKVDFGFEIGLFETVVAKTAFGYIGLGIAISKGRQGREAQNIVKVYLANLRLKEVGTDMLITAYEPIHINPLSESASAVGAGFAVPATQAGCMPMAEVFKLAVSSFKVNDWNLFGSAV
ncbi:Ran guanine nucleotide release factor [Morella rubra]|uniref:Ran guanine nucleotide release factor n=1 Tax=Morella rubra TaxID=262757 RepID=A0A6A1VA48_9ROSI|nr:Ran guanine nucleotide release factor [Morella rubra]